MGLVLTEKNIKFIRVNQSSEVSTHYMCYVVPIIVSILINTTRVALSVMFEPGRKDHRFYSLHPR